MPKPKLLLDENIGAVVVYDFRKEGYDVVSVLENLRGATDDKILNEALRENRVLVTLDKDFGRMVFLSSKKHAGVVFLRLKREEPKTILAVLKNVLRIPNEKFSGHFITASESSARVRG